MTTALERKTREMFVAWGLFAGWRPCSACSWVRYCRARRARGPYVCGECWEFSAEGERWLSRLI